MAEVNEQDAEILAPAMERDAADILADIRADRARLLRYQDGSRAVVRLEVTPTGSRELVLVAGAGKGYREKVAELVEFASAQGWTLRAHTNRPGIARMLAGLGFVEAERVMIHEQ